MQCLNFFQQVDSNGLILQSLTWINILPAKWCVPEVDLEYAKDLRVLHNDYLLVPDEIEIKKRNAVWVSTKDCWFIQYSYW